MKPLKIAMTGLRAIGPTSGGVERVVDEISTRLAARGHAVTVFCRARFNTLGETNHRGVRLLNRPAVYTKHLEAISHTFLALCDCLRGYDIVHIHATGPSLLAFLPRLCGRKVVVTVHALDWRREKWKGAARLILRMGEWTAVAFPHRTTVVSRLLQRHYREYHRRETVCIPNGISEGQPRPIQALRRLGVTGGDYVLYLGRLVPEKGCHLLIDAFREIPTTLKLLVVGETSHTDEYVRDLKRRAAGDSRIVFAGPLYDDDKMEAYSNAYCLAFPSTVEGMPLVMLEAMALGCPVLCSDIPEHLDVLQPAGKAEACAQVFPAGQADALRAALVQAFAAPDSLRAMARAARDFVLKEYSWDRAVDQLLAVYGELAGSPAGAR